MDIFRSLCLWPFRVQTLQKSMFQVVKTAYRDAGLLP